MPPGTLLAAVDLGSNSYRLDIARVVQDRIERVDGLKETVRQGDKLDRQGNLTEEALERGWACLARFGQRLLTLPRPQVRAVATQTLREARNRALFLARGEELLGCPIEVITGQEEARLIYLGVTHLLPDSDERRLVVDIGGRSTELILGRRFEANVLESCVVGSVALSALYFPAGLFTAAAFAEAEAAARAALAPACASFAPGSWDVVYGASGTIGAVVDVLSACGHAPETVTRSALDALLAQLLQAGSADRVHLPGLRDDRRPLIGGGVAVLRALFDLLGLDEMRQAHGALRHGVLYDLLARMAPAGRTPIASGALA